MKYWLLRSLQQKNKKNDKKNDDRPSAKWQKKTKSKGKKLIHHIYNELKYELILKLSSENDESDFNETDEKKVRVCSNFI